MNLPGKHFKYVHQSRGKIILKKDQKTISKQKHLRLEQFGLWTNLTNLEILHHYYCRHKVILTSKQ